MSIKFVNAEVKKILASYLYNYTPSLPNSNSSFPPEQRFLHDGSRSLPALDRYLRSYFSVNKYLGSGQRSSIVERVYGMIKWEYLLAYLTKSHPFDLTKTYRYDNHLSDQLEYKISLYNSNDFYEAIENSKLPKYLRASQNKELYRELSWSLMEEDDFPSHTFIYDGKHRIQIGNDEKAYQVSRIMNQRAPLTIRYNPMKTPRHSFIDRMEKKYKLRLYPCEFSPFGLKITEAKNVNLLETEEFQAGMFQIQDEGSQLCALQTKCRPGDLVLDYCGGSGGKSLAIAHQLGGKGQIFVHEPRQVALQKARKRFNRAGIQNVQFHSSEENMNKILLGKTDWVIVDAPCTGTGTLRRNPDLKLKFCPQLVKKNQILQAEIFARCMKYLSKSGRIVYITCSLLKQENEDQVEKFEKIHGLEVEKGEIMKILPQKDGMDGFFAVVMKRR